MSLPSARGAARLALLLALLAPLAAPHAAESWPDAPAPAAKKKRPRAAAAPQAVAAPPEKDRAAEPPKVVAPSRPEESDGWRQTRAVDPDNELEADGEAVRRPRLFSKPDLSEERLRGVDEPGYGLGAELTLAWVLMPSATGSLASHLGLGVTGVWQLGRVFAPEIAWLHDGLFVEAAYLHASDNAGTSELSVATSYHSLTASVLFGWPFKYALVYGKLGPGLFIMPVDVTVQGTTESFTGVKGGLAYGVGARSAVYLTDSLGFIGRLEFCRFRRGYLDDNIISAAVGLAF